MRKRKKPLVISKEELARKGTKELLGYMNRLHRCEESFELSDMDVNPDLKDETAIYFKQTEKWRKAYDDVKSILANREHIGKRSK